MGSKIIWTGLTLLLAGQVINLGIPSVSVVGAIVMVFGLILIWLDK